METLRIKGFRSIEDSGEIQLKPITVAIGKNSCGKSSFIRFFPLLKQSMEKEIAESLLWYGDYVDFGEYQNIKPNHGNESKTSFEMKFTLENYGRFYFGVLHAKGKNLQIIVKISIEEKFIERIELKYYDQNILIELNENKSLKKIIINNNENCIDPKMYSWYRESKCLIPLIAHKDDDSRMYYRFFHANQDIKKCILNMFSDIEISKEETDDIVNDILCICSQETVGDYLMHKCKNKKVCEYFMNNEAKVQEMNSYIVMDTLPSLLYSINMKMLEEAENLHYLKPIRANVNRYYRIQGASIDQVDSDGSNLAMILYNLDNRERQAFEKWCKDTFGIMFSLSKRSGHASLIIKDNHNNETNLADTGYGYSQILPIIVELWILLYKTENIRNKAITIVIEQPELHLHPAFQKTIIDLFSNLVKNPNLKNNNTDLKIIFETHSETMINRLGYLVNTKVLDENDVNILAFEKKDAETTIKPLYFNELGLIPEWPTGFFS